MNGDADETPRFREAFFEAADGFDNLVAFFETAVRQREPGAFSEPWLNHAAGAACIARSLRRRGLLRAKRK